MAAASSTDPTTKAPIALGFGFLFIVVMTFVIVTFAWVFFRATDLPSAFAYCGAMLGFGPDTPTRLLVPGQVYSLYHVGSVALAAAISWFGIQTWDFTRRITWPKAAICFGLLILSMVLLITKSYSPFIYFKF